MASNRACAVIYTTVVFLAGAVSGALLMNVTEHFWLHPQGHAIPAAVMRQPSEQHHYVEQFKKELNLSDAQARQVEGILDETVRQYHDLRSFSYHVREDGIARIRAILDDNQRKRFDDITRRAKDDQVRARKQQAPAR